MRVGMWGIRIAPWIDWIDNAGNLTPDWIVEDRTFSVKLFQSSRLQRLCSQSPVIGLHSGQHYVRQLKCNVLWKCNQRALTIHRRGLLKVPESDAR